MPAAYTLERAIAALAQTEDPSLRYYAAWWLGRNRAGDEVAIAALLEALKDETDRSPDGGYPLRRNTARALGKLRPEPRAIAALVESLSCSDYYVRAESARALGAIGDKSCIPALLDLLEGGPGAATRVPGKPHLRQPAEAVLKALGNLQAKEALEIVLPFLQHPMEKVVFAAGCAAYQLTQKNDYLGPLLRGLQAPNLALRRSALLSLGEIGYLPAADAIFATQAENSLKLVAMKGLLEKSLGQSEPLAAQNRHLMQLMDEML